MEVNFKSLPDSAKVWMYQSNLELTADQAKTLYELADVFLNQWESHNIPVQGSVDIIHNRFLRIAAFSDEESMCGRAQDAQVRLVKELEQELDLVFTDRMLLTFEIDGKPTVIHMNDVQGKIEEGLIQSETKFYNNLIQSKKEFDSSWETEVSSSWVSRFL